MRSREAGQGGLIEVREGDHDSWDRGGVMGLGRKGQIQDMFWRGIDGLTNGWRVVGGGKGEPHGRRCSSLRWKKTRAGWVSVRAN